MRAPRAPVSGWESAFRTRAYALAKYSQMGFQTLGFQFISSLFPERAPAGQEVLLAYHGGAQNSHAKDLEQVSLHTHTERLPLSLSPQWKHTQKGFHTYSTHTKRLPLPLSSISPFSTPPPYAIQKIFCGKTPCTTHASKRDSAVAGEKLGGSGYSGKETVSQSCKHKP